MNAGRNLLIFSDDWGRHPSSCQHLVTRLLARFPVTWVNTIGTRRPALNWYTVRRGLGKMAGWLASRPTEAADECTRAPAPRVVAPLMWPSFHSRLGRRLNRDLLTRALVPLVDRDTVAVTTIPVVADLVGRLPVHQWIYYCVDDLSSWPGLDRAVLEPMERELVAKVDGIIAVSEHLVARMATMGRAATLLTHGVDLEVWKSSAVVTDCLSEYPRPWVVFWGVVDRRLDVEWLVELSRRMRNGSILLIGPANVPDPAIDTLPHVRQVGPLAFAELPAIAREAAVLIMPYGDMPATQAMQPLKFKEYLATGRPVVARDLPATRSWGDACDLVATASAFTDRVLIRMREGAPAEQLRARERLGSEGWEEKARVFEQFVFAPHSRVHSSEGASR